MARCSCATPASGVWLRGSAPWNARVARAPGDELVAVEQPRVRGDPFHRGQARAHEARVVRPEEIEVSAKRDGFQLERL